MEKSLVKKWFMIHTYSGYEKKVKTDLEQKIETLGLTDIVTKVLVPEEETIEERRGKKKVVSRKLFPGYVMLEMEATREENGEGISFRVDSDAWYVVRNTNGVTGFVGVGSDPIPMEDDEVENIFSVIGYRMNDEDKAIKEVIKVDYEVGDYVRLLAEGFENQEGKVAEIDMEHRKVKVMMEMFGRMTPIEVDLNNVEKA
ncbi:transcription termination/antitermination protein NusG [uncultured Cetobacterium sp.]|uniref:transcription termination/antitermination protein NusG n=1 Tax=uncultured Cetobacterium sp. TaxID=527638 RepID=UPI00262EF4A1|nr:transcription termination/antitermination protein NusG [uncultured Cetobacterium sp.]